MKTQNLETIATIKTLAKNNPGIGSSEVAKEIGITYDTTARYLKGMTDNEVLTRKAFANKKEKRYSWEKGQPWTYHYYIKTGAKK